MAFAHKGGLHVSARECDPNSYQHVDRLRVLISKLSGRQNILGKMRMLDLFGDNGGGGGGAARGGGASMTRS